jgi:hypothetical protein
MERSSPVRNRMLEIGASGSVGGEGGNILVHPANPPYSAGKSAGEGDLK